MIEHWQYAALGALSMTPIVGVFWAKARGWRLKAKCYVAEIKALASVAEFDRESACTLADQVIELTIKLNDERAVTANQSDRLNRIIGRGKTQKPNSTVQAMVRIAEGG